MLIIEDLHVQIGQTEVLKGVDLHLKPGETFILFGPNGSGKTTLLMTLMGFADYKVTRGRIIFKGEDITNLPMYERARLGLGLSFQRPPTIHGLTVEHLAHLCARGQPLNLGDLAERLHFTEFLQRDINAGFSGGEIKRSELLQLMAQRPSLLLFDEPESGVDLENMALVGHAVRRLLEGQPAEEPEGSGPALKHRKSDHGGLIITHTGYILQYIEADHGQVMYDGVLCCEARPREILEHVAKYGYQECVCCLGAPACPAPAPERRTP